MYYEEVWVEGRLFYRTTPEGRWHEYSLSMYASRLAEKEAEILGLKTELVQTLIEHRDRLDEIITHLDPMALVNDSLKKLNA